MRFSIAAMTLMAVSYALSVAAKEAPADRNDFSGIWAHAGDRKETEQRRLAIEAVTEDLPFFIRGTARERLTERTAPPPELQLTVDKDRFDITRDGKSVSLRFEAKPIMIEQNGKRGLVSVRYEQERIVVVSEGDKSKRLTKYALSPERNRLTMSVSMTGESLSGPLIFQSTYRRK